MVFYAEGEFLFDYLEWFLGDLTLDDSGEEGINVLLSNFVAYVSFVVFGYREELEGWTVKGFLFFCIPMPSFCFYLFFCHREIFLSDCFIVTKR